LALSKQHEFAYENPRRTAALVKHPG
jgi:hypothetical protein